MGAQEKALYKPCTFVLRKQSECQSGSERRRDKKPKAAQCLDQFGQNAKYRPARRERIILIVRTCGKGTSSVMGLDRHDEDVFDCG